MAGVHARDESQPSNGVSISLSQDGNAVVSLFHVSGKAAAEYVSDETPMIHYTNLHLALEQKRVLANRASRNSPPPPGHDHNNEDPPRVLIIGPENSGKTTVTKILANYAIRSPAQWAPIIVNLDTNDVSIGGRPLGV